jgi:serine/threonine protein phosphatase PrpC
MTYNAPHELTSRPTWPGVLAVAPTHKIRFASQTDVGIKRSHNQDACATQPAADERHFASVGHVFVVADGMGGHAVGEKASAKAVRDVPLIFRKHVITEGPEAAVRRAFEETNAGIYDIGANNPEFKGLGTTCVALFLRPEGAWVGHVGDSRVYRVRGDRVEQLTFDHSWVWEIARRQGLDPDELGDFKRNVIIRSLGPEADVEPDVEGPHPVEPGDSFLLCSDGLTNHVRPDELGAVVAVMPPAEACAFLVELANLRGGTDNITCLIVQVPRGDGNTADELAPATKPGAAARLVKWWAKTVSWPITLLVLGGALVALSVWLKLEELPLPLCVGVFALAVMCTFGGLGLMAVQFRKRADEKGKASANDRELHVYKTHPIDISQTLVQRFAEEELAAKKALDERLLTADAAAVQKWAELAAAKAKAGEWGPTLRARCQALQLLAAVLNKNQNKNEEFKPNWTTPHRAVGG